VALLRHTFIIRYSVFILHLERLSYTFFVIKNTKLKIKRLNTVNGRPIIMLQVSFGLHEQWFPSNSPLDP